MIKKTSAYVNVKHMQNQIYCMDLWNVTTDLCTETAMARCKCNKIECTQTNI